MAAVPEGGLLDALPAAVQPVTGELDDVERVHHLSRVGQGLLGGGLEPREPVHRHHLDAVPERRRLRIEPGGERLLGAAGDNVEQPGGTRALAHRGQVDDHGHVSITEPSVPPGVLVDADHLHPV